MIKNYLQVTLRNIRNNKLLSFLNIAGLAIGVTACFLIWQYVRFESSYDSFHENAADLYRVTYHVMQNGTPSNALASNVPALGHAMVSEFGEVKQSCRLVQTSLFTSDLGRYYANALEFSYESPSGKLVAFNEDKVWFADAPILSMFSFPLIAGSVNALEQPNSVVVTEAIARKYFGDILPLGQTLRLNRDMMLTVTGVIKDVPVNSHLQFDILISFSTMRSRLGDMYDNWGWAAFYTYILLEPGADARELEAKLPAFKEMRVGRETEDYKTSYKLQPITDIHLKSQLQAEQSPTGSDRTVYFLSILAVFILVVAWINYVNLSTAKALERSKEVGLRKTVGATRSQLIAQFLIDTFVINFIALAIAACLVVVLWSAFESLVGKQLDDVFTAGGMTPWILATLMFLVGVLISGIYPALTLSSFTPAKVLKGKFYKTAGGTVLRKAMISFQYVLSLLLIAGTATIYLQLSHMRSLDTGFTKDQVLVVESPAVYDSTAGQKIAHFKNGILKLPGVRNVSAVSDVPGKPIVENSPVQRKNDNPDGHYFHAYIPSIDTAFFSTFDISILEGRLFETNERMEFRRKDKNESIPVLVNENFVRQMNLSNEDALNENIRFYWGPDERSARIIGVVSNHHQVSFKNEVQAMMYMQPSWQASKYFAVRLERGAIPDLASIEDLYKGSFTDHPFSWFFLDEHFDRQYRDDQQFGNIFNVFTALAIVVTCLGLLGLSVFSVSQRSKEMGIRKVLGAAGTEVLLLFVSDFLKLLAIAYLIAVPLIYFASDRWLDNFSSRIVLPWQSFAVPVFVLLTTTLVTIFFVTIKAATDTPVKAIRQD